MKQAGALIMRIAQPILDTKFGRGVVNGSKFVANIAVEAGYKVVEGTEWVIDKTTNGLNYIAKKGTDLTNYVAKKATDLTNYIADTRLVKGAVGLVKNVWSGMTEVFQPAVNLAIFVFRKISNFCTAVSESYQYYNQCRTITRRIVNETNGRVDEHFLIKTFQGVSQQEAKNTQNNLNTDDVS